MGSIQEMCRREVALSWFLRYPFFLQPKHTHSRTRQERAARDMLLRHERRTILEAAAENVLAFDEAVYDLRRERMMTAAHLKAAELKLLVLRQASIYSA